jgi:hypothetical protein
VNIVGTSPLVSRKVSPALFIAILVAFALPFGAVSCEGPPVEFTGYELATWHVQQTTPPATTRDGDDLPTAIEEAASWTALLMLVGTIAGLVVGLVRRRGAGFAVMVALIAAFGLVTKMANSPGAEPRRGFGVALLLLVILAIWHAALAIRRGRLSPRPLPKVPPGAVPLSRVEHPHGR